MPKKLSIMDHLLGIIENKKPSDRFILRGLLFLTIATGIYFALSVNNSFLITTPTKGGVLIEGIVGIPRFVNPALAITRADQDTVALIYSGLMKIDEKGALVPDLAENISVSEDGLIYTITLKKNRVFHDETPITAKDVIFTINLMRDPDLKSPLRGNWNDVTINEVGEYELTIALAEAYAPFIENFIFGVMPEHIWSGLPIEQLPFSQYNTEPIGSGPFMIAKVNRDNTGLISGYSLRPAPSSVTEPNLSSIELKFFQNETLLATALENKEITSTIFLPSETILGLNQEEIQVITHPLPRVFGIFFNQNRSVVLRDKSAREALNVAIDRKQLVAEVLDGFGVPTTEPIVTEHRELILQDTAEEDNSTSTLQSPEEILKAGGWKKNEAGFWEKKLDESNQILSVTIRTGNSPLFQETANMVAESWRKIGVDVQIEQYEQTGLVQSVIRSRDFEALLFGLDMNRLQDLYPFWHSSQKDDPGLNISQYTNVNVDRLLEEARTTVDSNEQLRLLKETSKIIASEVPAIFLFAPNISYVVNKDINASEMKMLGRPADRFMNISNWHARTTVVWPIFEQN